MTKLHSVGQMQAVSSAGTDVVIWSIGATVINGLNPERSLRVSSLIRRPRHLMITLTVSKVKQNSWMRQHIIVPPADKVAIPTSRSVYPTYTTASSVNLVIMIIILSLEAEYIENIRKYPFDANDILMKSDRNHSDGC